MILGALPYQGRHYRDNGRRRGSGADSARRTKRKAPMRPLVVVVPHVLVERSLKMAPTPDQHPVQTLLPDRLYPALGDRVGIRRLDRGRNDLGAVGGEDVVEGAGELGIAVTEQESTRRVVLGTVHLHRERSYALGHPRSVRMVGDASNPNLPSVQFDEEQDVEGPEAHGLHSEEVGRDDASGLRSKERSPGDRCPSGCRSQPVAQQ
jgi:hypothetical protein